MTKNDAVWAGAVFASQSYMVAVHGCGFDALPAPHIGYDFIIIVARLCFVQSC